MEIECYPLGNIPFDITPADRQRLWMDQTKDGLAYRCLPLSMANSFGWFFRCVESFDAVWHGGDSVKDIELFPAEEGTPLVSVESHFGYGILSFKGFGIFRTSPGYNLWVMGPTNAFKDAIQPLNGLIETDWMPHPFSMNWKFTRPETRISFEKAEPYGLIFPVRRRDFDDAQPVLRTLESHPELQAASQDAHRLRGFGTFIKRNNPDGSPFQGWYMNGEIPYKRGTFEDHQRHIKVNPFKNDV